MMAKATMPTDEKRKILAKYLPDEPDKRDEIYKMDDTQVQLLLASEHCTLLKSYKQMSDM